MSFIIYRKEHNGHLAETLPHAQAVKIQAALRNRSGAHTASQTAFLDNIKAVYLGDSQGLQVEHERVVEQPTEAQLLEERYP